jgi:uncharacterized phiE125 gp8 family phage protein
MGLTSITTSASPVTLAEARAYLRIDGGDDDAVLASIIEAATEWVEDQTRQQLRTTVLEYTLDAFPCGREIRLPKPPLRSVEAVWYFNPAGQEAIFPSAAYKLDTSSKPGRIILKPGFSWPVTDGSPQAVRIEYTAGYDDAAPVPAVLKQAIKFMAGHWFENREAAIDRRIDAVPLTVESVLQQHSYPELV